MIKIIKMILRMYNIRSNFMIRLISLIKSIRRIRMIWIDRMIRGIMIKRLIRMIKYINGSGRSGDYQEDKEDQ